jgi:virulence-associated protein VagC
LDTFINLTLRKVTGMKTLVIKSDRLNLPEEIARKLKGKEVEFIETKEGILIKPIENPIKKARAKLKESSARYWRCHYKQLIRWKMLCLKRQEG